MLLCLLGGGLSKDRFMSRCLGVRPSDLAYLKNMTTTADTGNARIATMITIMMDVGRLSDGRVSGVVVAVSVVEMGTVVVVA